MEISQDIFIQITEMRPHPNYETITHSLNMEHLLVMQFPATTDSFGNCTLQKAIL